MRVLLDTNILLRTSQTDHAMHQHAVDAAALLRAGGKTLCVVPQNLYEYWVVCTRPKGENGLGLSIAEAEMELNKLTDLLTIVDDTPVILPAWRKLVIQHQVIGKNAHDARPVAAMIVHKIERILTFNIADFQRYKEIEAVSPMDVVKS